jgi:hypothetical protein
MREKYPIYEVSLKVARLRLFMAGVTDAPDATEEDIARALRARGVAYDDVQAIWQLVGTDGAHAVGSILSMPEAQDA